MNDNLANSPAEFVRLAAQAYFDACDATRERVDLKNGEITYHQVPYTMAGLCAQLGVARSVLEEISKAPPPDRSKESMSEEDELKKVLHWAVARVEQYTVERALLGELNSSVASMLLRGWGYNDEKKPEPQNQSVQVVLEDPCGYAQ
ncbi:DNA-packaging protein [Eubacteriales bacterium OttesenSCG-928-K08]|nr:DNA-packaging protein [Eubacteriales bacterium OttesenSCG-928-K08]